MKEMGLDASRRELGIVSLEEHYAHNVISDVPLALQLDTRQNKLKAGEKRRVGTGSSI